MTTYTLRPPIKPRERILVFGAQGTGKSSGILEIAKRVPDVTFHVCDTEFGNYDRLLAADYPEVTNVDVTVIDSWDAGVEAVDKANASMDVDDWLVVDVMGDTWDLVQSWFVERVHGTDIDEFFIEKRRAMQEIRDSAKKKGADAPKGFAAINGEDGDWTVINKAYFKLYSALLKCPGHVYLTATQDDIGKRDEKAVRTMFGSYGVKPKGQKRLAHVPHTVLWLTKNRSDEWYVTTVKDRGRKELDDAALSNFASDYLMRTAGWRPRPIEVTA